jgi:hypothetical protein
VLHVFKLLKKEIPLNRLILIIISIFSRPVKSPIIPTIKTAMDLTEKEIIKNSPLAAEGFKTAFSCTIASITDMMNKTLLQPSYSLKVPQLRTPATPQPSKNERASPPIHGLSVCRST